MRDNQIILGDCIEGLGKLPGGVVPLVVTSPPYDDLREFGSPWTWEVFLGVADQLCRVLEDRGIICWQVQDAVVKSGPREGSYSGSSYRQMEYFCERGLLLWDVLIAGGVGCRHHSPRRYGSALQYIFVLSKGLPGEVRIHRDRLNRSAGSRARATERLQDGSVKHRRHFTTRRWGRRTNIWLYATGASTTDREALDGHPAVMIEALARDLIMSYSRPGDLVVDPFGGSGTTGKVARLNSRRYLLFEQNPEYHALATRRLSMAEVQYRLELDRDL